MNGGIEFDSNNLQTYDRSTGLGIHTSKIIHTSLPEKVATLFARADTDGSTIPAINYSNKKIQISGFIRGSSQADLDNRIDSFKAFFNGSEKNLDIEYGSGTRRYIATANTISVERSNTNLIAIFSIEFVCTNPFGLDLTATDLWTPKVAFSGATFTETPTIGGSAPYQLPIITITINSLTGAGDYVQISNDNNGQEMMIYGQSLQAGDVIEINASDRTVKINGNDADYYGTFLELDLGSASITYTDGFTTRSVDISGSYVKRWL